MGNGHSLACGKNHIYDKIDENMTVKSMMGNRKESITTLDVKINDLDKMEKQKGTEDSAEDWTNKAADDWFQEKCWSQQQFRKREDILYNIFMLESGENHLDGIHLLRPKRGSEVHYGRLASLDVSVLDNVKSENNYF